VNSTLLYLDSSGLVKLVRAQAETTRLFGFLQDWPLRVSSVIARVEVLRAVGRVASDTTTYRRAEAARRAGFPVFAPGAPEFAAC